MPHILYIHGANATSHSFNFIRSMLPEHTYTPFKYDANTPLIELIDDAIDAINQPMHIIAHSLGGIIGVAASQRDSSNVLSVTTMGTPFAGSEAATRMSILLPFYTFLKNVNIHNPTLKEIISKGPVVPTTNIITVGGSNAFELKPNDGVVTVESQLAFKGKQITADLNHFEVLLSMEVVSILRSDIWKY